MVLHQIFENIQKLCTSARAHQLRFVVTKYSMYVRKEVTNMTSNQIRYWELQESKRANREREQETRRSNRVNERLTRAYQEGTLDLRAKELAETTRAHQATEAINLASQQELARHNVVYEKETARHNLATESLTGVQLDIAKANLSETVRSHKASEAISRANLSELRRHNVAQEGISSQQLQIESQYKQAMVDQGLQRIDLDKQHIENERQRVVNETIARRETARHNKAQEDVWREQNELRGYDLVIRGIESAVKIGSSVAMAIA